MALTTNLEIDLDSFVGAGPAMREAVKAAFEKVDDRLTILDNITDAADATAVVTKFNLLLDNLKATGLMEADA